jgi:fatty-acyl-CoA synthase
MKLSFSTLGCPNWTWREIISAAVDLGYNGIELRGLGEDIFLPKIDLFSPEHIRETRDDLSGKGLSIPCVTSDVCLHLDNKDYVASGRLYIALAANIGAKYVRLLGDTGPAPLPYVDEDLVQKRLEIFAPIAEASGVTLLVETNGVFADTKRLKNLIERVDSPAVGVLWDLHHPVRYFGEPVEKTYANIGKYVHHVHIKDSVMENGQLQYKMLGYGDLPIDDCLHVLKSAGYDEFISLEWTKRWNMELEDAGIVFSHFAHAIRRIWDMA